MGVGRVFIKTITTLVILSAAGLSAQTFQDSDISGVAGLKIAPGAAHAGSAEAFGSVATDLFSLYYNPAGAVFAGKYSAGFMHHEWIEGVRSEFVGFIWRPDKVAVGASLLYNSAGELERREIATSEPLSLFDAQDFAAALTASFTVSPELAFGATAKVIYERIDISSGTAFAVDLGGYYEFMPNIHIGMSVSNLGSKMKLEDQEDDLPTTVRAGGSYTYRTFRVGLNMVTPTDDNVHVHFGAESTVSEILTLRAGYASGYDIRDIAFGLGVKHRFASFDYAYTPIKSDLSDSHRFSLTISWR